MTRISRISAPRATALAFALLTVVMLALAAMVSDGATGDAALAGHTSAAARECEPAEQPPCPHAASQVTVDAAAGGRDEHDEERGETQ